MGGFVGFATGGIGSDPSANWTIPAMGGFVGFATGGIGSDPSAKRTIPAMGGFVGFATGGIGSDPSANATEANDMNNNVTARIRFMVILLMVGNAPQTV